MKCVKCKKNIEDGDLFCGYCGINQKKFSTYISNVEKNIRVERDTQYKRAVRQAQDNLKMLEQAKVKEIDRIVQSRWFRLSNNFSYNEVEGKININGRLYLFSDIKGAEIVSYGSYRIMTTETSKSKKHISLGKAVVGGAVFGPIGAIAGGSMGKTTSSGKAISNSIPTCNYIGVRININGFMSEITLMNQTIDQTSSAYINNMDIAQCIVDTLRRLSVTPVPKNFLKPEEVQSVLDFDPKISSAAKRLRETINNRPTYEIPQKYYE